MSRRGPNSSLSTKWFCPLRSIFSLNSSLFGCFELTRPRTCSQLSFFFYSCIMRTAIVFLRMSISFSISHKFITIWKSMFLPTVRFKRYEKHWVWHIAILSTLSSFFASLLGFYPSLVFFSLALLHFLVPQCLTIEGHIGICWIILGMAKASKLR